MLDKKSCVVNIILRGVAILLLLAAAFDVLPWTDNFVIFLAIALFIVSWMVSRITRAVKGEGACCK